MSQTQSNHLTTDVLLGRQSSPASPSISHDDLEFACVNLISQFENQVDSAKSRSNHVENAGENADKLLSALLNFCEENLSSESVENVMGQIEKASFASLAHKESLNSLGWGFAISNLFGKSVSSDETVRKTYTDLGNELLAACVAVLREAIAIVGTDCETGKSIEQSTAVFVEEFKANW
jgi:hypothetical protein